MWLVKDDLVVTAAHCIYNRGEQATCVKAYIGYDTRAGNDGISALQKRLISRITLPLDWVNAGAEHHDVAFLQLDSPFQNATPLALGTPGVHARQQLMVVGYATDIGTAEDPGDRLHEMKVDRDIDLERTKWNMLTYQGDINGGKYTSSRL